MAMTQVPDNPAYTLPPTGPAGPTSANPVYTACDPANGNYFTATGRDLVTFYLNDETSAPAWLVAGSYGVGQVVSVTGPAFYVALLASSGQNPTGGAPYWAGYTGSSVNIASAPDQCAGRISNVVGYDVPLGAGSVEFLVMPSSVFTQAGGQVQFLASSNLVSVYVRSL